MRQLSRALTCLSLLLAACDSRPAPASALGKVTPAEVMSVPAAAPAPVRRVMARSAPPAADLADEAGVDAQAGAPGSAVPAFDPSIMIIRSATAGVEVDSLDRAVERARAAAARFGGIVANASVATGRNEVHRAVLQVRVPAARFDSLLAGLAPLGRVEGVNISTQDVGEEYVDIEARLVNLRRLEARLLELLANRTGKLSDVLSVERELARVRGEIEQIEGRRRWLQRSVAMSTVELTLHEPEKILAGTPGTNPIADAVHDAWRNAVASVAWAIASLGVVLPLAVLLGALALVARWAWRRSHGGEAAGARA